MEQSPSCGVNSRSASQEIPRLLWNPKVNTVFTTAATGPYPEPDASSPSLRYRSRNES